jgi:cell division protein FtsZ
MGEDKKYLDRQIALALAEPEQEITNNEEKSKKGGRVMLEFEEEVSSGECFIKVVGVGGAGGNAINRMAEAGLKGVDFVAVNTDMQVLNKSLAQQTVQIGTKLTRGLGSGGNPEIGRRAFEEDKERITEILKGTDMLFVAAGMGGGTGTGAAPMVAQTVGVVTKPFEWEGRQRLLQAEEGIRELKENVDTLIVIPNQRVLTVVGKQAKLTESFKIIDDILLKAVRGISDLITVPGLVNVDFADVRSVMMERGDALMGVGVAQGENRAILAAQEAIANTLLEGVSISGAKAVLLNISCGDDLTMHEVHEAATEIRQAAGEGANLIFGTVIDETSNGSITITVIATGLGSPLSKLEKDIPDDNRIDFNQIFRKDNAPKSSFQRKDQVQTVVTKGQVGVVKQDDLEIPTYMRRLMD